MMRIVAVHGPGNLIPSADHGAVHINGQTAQIHGAHLIIQKLAVNPHQRAQRGPGELFEPIDYSAVAGHARQTTQPRKQRVRTDITQLAKPPASHHQQADDQHYQVHTAVVASKLVSAKRPPDAPMQPDDPEIAAYQLQTAIRSKPLACEFHRQVLLDHLPQPHYLQPHLRGLPCRLELRGQRILNYAWKALFLQPLSLFLQNYFRIRVRRRVRESSRAPIIKKETR